MERFIINLQTLSQGFRSVDEYFKEMKVTIIRANISEDKVAMMVRFLNELNKEIDNIVELQHYMKIDDMIHMVVKIEKQFRRKGSAKPGAYSCSFLDWKLNFKKKGNALMKPMTTPKIVEPLFVRKQVIALKEKKENIA